MKYQPISSELFIANRKNFVSKLKPNSIAVFNSNDESIRNGDTHFLYRQNSDIFYLSGIDQEETILVLFPDCPNKAFREALFLKRTSELIEIWEGHKYTMDEARKASGIHNIFWVEDFETLFKPLMNLAENCYLNLNENDRAVIRVEYKDLRFAHQLQTQYPLHKYERAAPIMARLRSIKSDLEIEQVKEAVEITNKAFRRLLGFVKPGVMEYEIEAEITHEFLRNRASGHAYYPIIASGASACVLHYVENNKPCRDGDVILLDFGAEYANYAADLTRSIPVSGRYTQRQKDVYNAVLRVLKEATKMLVPGNTLEKYHREVGLVMEQELIQLGLLNSRDVGRQNPENPLYKKYFMHGTSHFMGLDVHDTGMRWEPMKEGMLFSCEPGIYIREENLGIRIENDILITAKGPVNLMANIPIEADEIESLMNS
jgi:Xaa-Pro aminopeptidase